MAGIFAAVTRREALVNNAYKFILSFGRRDAVYTRKRVVSRNVELCWRALLISLNYDIAYVRWRKDKEHFQKWD